MAYVGGGWRSGQSGDITGTASTATVSSLSVSSGPCNGGLIAQTVTGTGFANGDVIYAAYVPLPTTYISATQLSTTAFNSMPDGGGGGTIPVGVKKTGQALSNTVNFTATAPATIHVRTIADFVGISDAAQAVEESGLAVPLADSIGVIDTADPVLTAPSASATATLLTSGAISSGSGGTGFTTASVTPGANCLLVLLTAATVTSSAATARSTGTTSSSGSGPDTWTVITDNTTAVSFGTISGAEYAAITSDPGSFTVTHAFTNPGGGFYSRTYALYKVTGHNTSTPIGGTAQRASPSSGSSEGNGARTITLSAAPATNDVTLALSHANPDSGGAATFDTGWTSDVAGSGAVAVAWAAGHRDASTSTSVAWTDVNTGTGSYTAAQVAVVVKAA